MNKNMHDNHALTPQCRLMFDRFCILSNISFFKINQLSAVLKVEDCLKINSWRSRSSGMDFDLKKKKPTKNRNQDKTFLRLFPGEFLSAGVKARGWS